MNATALVRPTTVPPRRFSLSGHTAPVWIREATGRTSSPTARAMNAGSTPASSPTCEKQSPALPRLAPTRTARPRIGLRTTSAGRGSRPSPDRSTTAGMARSTPQTASDPRDWPMNGPMSAGTAIIVSPYPGANTATGPRAIPA